MQTQTLCRVATATPVYRSSYAKWICIIVLFVLATRVLYLGFIRNTGYTERLVNGNVEKTQSQSNLRHCPGWQAVTGIPGAFTDSTTTEDKYSMSLRNTGNLNLNSVSHQNTYGSLDQKYKIIRDFLLLFAESRSQKCSCISVLSSNIITNIMDILEKLTPYR